MCVRVRVCTCVVVSDEGSRDDVVAIVSQKRFNTKLGWYQTEKRTKDGGWMRRTSVTKRVSIEIYRANRTATYSILFANSFPLRGVPCHSNSCSKSCPAHLAVLAAPISFPETPRRTIWRSRATFFFPLGGVGSTNSGVGDRRP